ncbi:MAG: DUF1559 domain-containing protein [Gemmataceae bacterium]|nr:DUF1559 domain-containing protein [Gemmataceae bacterium]
MNSPWVRAAGVAVSVCALSFCSADGQTPPPPAGDEPAAEKLPEGLRHVPADALAFLHIRVGDFLKSDLGKQLLMQIQEDKEAAKTLADAEKKFGLAVTDIESVTLVFLQPPQAAAPEMMRDVVPRVEKEALSPFEMKKGFAPFPPKGFDFRPAEKLKFEFKSDGKKPAHFREDVEGANEPEMPVSIQDPLADLLLHRHQSSVAMPPLMIVSANKALNRKHLIRAVMMDRAGGARIPFLPTPLGDGNVLFLSDRSFMVGETIQLWDYVHLVSMPVNRNLVKRAPAPLSFALDRGAKGHLITAGAQASPRLTHETNRTLVPFYPLFTMPAASATVDLGKKVELHLELRGRSERQAALAAQSLKTAIATLEITVEEVRKIADAQGAKPVQKVLGAEAKLQQLLAAAKVQHEGPEVHCRLSVDLTSESWRGLVAEVVAILRETAGRAQSVLNLKQIALAMHSHYDVFKGLPPHALRTVKGKDGGPLLSWRVAILPFIEEDALYRQFDLDLPWDHPHNKKLIEKMPKIYAAPGIATKAPGLTHYQVFVGPGTVFEDRSLGNPRLGIRLADIRDGTSNTLLVVEGAEPVIWTKPDDLPYDPKRPLPKIGGLYGDGFNAAFADGAVRYLRNLDEQTFRALITRNGGEVVRIPE